MIPALVTAFVMLDADQRDVERMPSVCVQDQPDDQIVGPDSIKDHHVLFNIVAQAPPDIPRDKLREMALTLLTWRFQLGLHRETRELRYLALVIDKGGSKMARDERGRFRRSRNCSSGPNRILARLRTDADRSVDAVYTAADSRYDGP